MIKLLGQELVVMVAQIINRIYLALKKYKTCAIYLLSIATITFLSGYIIYLYINPNIVYIDKPEYITIQEEIIIEKEVEVITEIEKEIIIEVEKEPIYTYNITSVEREMLARIVYLEANGESLECQKAVVSVIINRWQNGYWGDSIKDVIYSRGQFSPAKNIYKTTPTERNYEAVDYVLKNGCTLPKYVLYFRSSHHFNWKGYVPYTIIDKTYFGYCETDK